MTTSSRSVSPSLSLGPGATSSPAGRVTSHPVHFAKKDDLLIRQDSEYCSQYLRDIHAIFSKKIIEAPERSGKENNNIYQPINFEYFDTGFFLEIECRRESPIPAGGLGRGPVSEYQASFNRLLFDVVRGAIYDANVGTVIEFDPEKPRDLQALALGDRKKRLPISVGNFMSRIEGAVVRVFSSKMPEQKDVTGAVYFAGSAADRLRAEKAIAVRRQQSMDVMVDAVAAEDFRKSIAQLDLPPQF